MMQNIDYSLFKTHSFRLAILLICYAISSHISAFNLHYKSFYNITVNIETSTIYNFTQDKQGLIWIATNKGLFSYDSYSTQQHFIHGEISNTAIYTLLEYADTYLFLGTDNGLLLYNYKTDKYESLEIEGLRNVRALVIINNTIYIGSLDGLYNYNIETKKLSEFIGANTNEMLPHRTIYSLLESNRELYIGTYDGLSKYNQQHDTLEAIILPLANKGKNQFINALLEDKSTNTIWIGTEGALYSYNARSKEIKEISQFQNNSIKSLALDADKNLLLGTDNGMYIYNSEKDIFQHIVHDSRNNNSLSNNIVWSIFMDADNNIWIGTDYGISLSRYNQSMQNLQIAQLTGVGDGNSFRAIHKDSKGNFCLGGTNGLIMSSSLNSESSKTKWYKMGDSKYPISHNRIRDIYEDSRQNLWVATDGGLNRYNYKTHQFENHPIVDSTNTLNSNWAYHIFEDAKKRLWLATCLGGIFVVDREKLQQTKGTYMAEQTYSTKNGLPDNFINQIVEDKEGNVWVLLYNKGICKINVETESIEEVSINCDNQPNFILADRNGLIWVAIKNGVVNINPKNINTETIKLDISNNSEILALHEVEDDIWVSTTEGVWVLNKDSQDLRKLNIKNNQYTSLYYDMSTRTVYLGSVDNIGIYSESDGEYIQSQDQIVLTGLIINGHTYTKNHAEQSIRYLDKIQLTFEENNLSFKFSDLLYSSDEYGQFVYKLEGLDDTWLSIEQNTNHINFSNLNYGRYVLWINKLDQYGRLSKESFFFNIDIKPPWYYSASAKIIYCILILAVIAWIINFFRVRNNLKTARIEKEKTLELVDLKLEFFTNISHELKTPLTLIIAPLSKLLLETNDPASKKLLNSAHQNALKLNSLTRQLLDFNRENEDKQSSLVFSQIDLVEFSRSIYSTYEEAFSNNLKFHFQSNKPSVIASVDVLKIESILNNLVSNACKYAKESSSISLSVNHDTETDTFNIRISDTGVGIPAEELPYIFEKFYQSSKTKKTKEGTGIGLHIVKKYTEQHGGQVQIASEENEGTTITLSFPLISDPKSFKNENYSPLDNQSKNHTILIVEDNHEIAYFIEQTLSSSYKCIIAHNGKAGLDVAVENTPDLIVSDIMMPIMDGMEMSKLLKKNIPTSTIPIILLTAKDDTKTELESLYLHVDAFISKPFDPLILLSKIEQLLMSRQIIKNKLRIENIAAPQAIEAVSPDEKFLSTLIEIIENKITDPDLNVAALSEISGFGSKQIYRKLKQLTGKSPVEYIRFIRIQKAAMLLQERKFTISEIVYMVGFSSLSYFSKCFKQELEITPRQFLEKQEIKE